MKPFILALLFVIAVSGTGFAIGYTVFLRDQVEPMYNTIEGDGGTAIQVLNPGDTPSYPATFRTVVCIPPNFSIYSAAQANRLEVWEDSAGVATAEDITTACEPLWNRNNSSSQ
jgi:hypothetical protein